MMPHKNRACFPLLPFGRAARAVPFGQRGILEGLETR